ncbi:MULTISPECIES: exonuclease domain-containing protein [Pacificibacter]|uniref:exonuclease domain-containing protein n=1 Tax=Pacificibacter TaxID=1042323 RepID=UPI001C08AAFA|nr:MULTISPECIES: exonuclease domain-containing protein [Pacificibacter]MBU2934531.1 exodeoxyribonuclease I [Pacificibacter marinus]MDO6617300.1 exonuclease domain-containing protein [Pacificibacter sp. 1_MG-2023]
MFAFYDLETTGTSPAFDQPLQFAAILTDDDFNQVERVDIRCRLAPHILPAPWALAVTGVSPDQLMDPALPSWFEFSHQISDLIKRWAPATWTGYNTLAFDEEFLRQSFYQNLHPNLYQTQFDNNDRLDLMKVIYAVRDLEPNALEWPLDDLGRESFKLDRLAPANGFANHDAHDALGDVEATIHVASLVRKRAPAVWEQCLLNRDKHQVGRLLQSGHPVCLIERFGAAPPRSYFGAYAGTNPQNKNSVAFLDLDLCDASIIDANDRDLAKAVAASPKLIRTIAINKAPNLFPVANPSSAHSSLAQLVSAHSEFHKRVGQALADRYAGKEPAQHVEQLIYDGFYSAEDKRVLEDFTAGDWRNRARIVAQLDDIRLKQLGMRLIFSNAPEFVSMNYRSAASAAIRDRWLTNEPSTPWTTKATVDEQLDEIMSGEVLDRGRICALQDFYQARVSEIDT